MLILSGQVVVVASSEKLQEQMNSQKTGLHNPSTLPNSSIFFTLFPTVASSSRVKPGGSLIIQ